MNKFLSLVVVFVLANSFIFTHNLYAQVPQAMPGNNVNMPAPSNIGHVYGKLTDADGKPLSGASVMLMQRKLDTDTNKVKLVLVKGMITKSNGDFDLEELP